MKTLISFIFLATVTRAAMLVTPIVTGSGPYTYSYSIANVGDDPILEISFTASGLITNIVSPGGWVGGMLFVGSDTSVTWVSTDIPFDIANGGSLSGFGLMSSAPPGSVVFTALTESFTNDNTATTGPVAPAAPEPGTALLLVPAVLGMWAAAWVLMRRMRRTLVAEEEKEPVLS